MDSSKPGNNVNIYRPDSERTVSVGDWIGCLALRLIPFVFLIMLFIWAFSKETPTSKANWAKAQLIWIAISIVVLTVICVFAGAFILAVIQQFQN